MENFYSIADGKLQAMAGCRIEPTIAEAIELATKRNAILSFDFNGVTVLVSASSDPTLILRDWNRALNQYIDGPIGPHPDAVLSESTLARDAQIEAANQARRATASAEYERKAAIKAAATDERLAQAPPMELKDPDAWRLFDEKNRDPYGHGVFVYAEQWARLMQVDMGNGANLVDIADRTSSEADTEGITGFMYGCAVGALAKCWQHGEELRRWHNLKTQIGDEGERANASGGVLNPALLNIG